MPLDLLNIGHVDLIQPCCTFYIRVVYRLCVNRRSLTLYVFEETNKHTQNTKKPSLLNFVFQSPQQQKANSNLFYINLIRTTYKSATKNV